MHAGTIVFDDRGLNQPLTVQGVVLLEPRAGIDTLRITADQSGFIGVVKLHQAIKRLVCQGSNTLFQRIVTLNPDASLDFEFPAAPSGVVYTNTVPNFQRGAIDCNFIMRRGNELKAGGKIFSTDDGAEFSTTAF
jgi:hypothetical protein